MNDGVKLLLERIKTHPEEFIQNHSGLFSSHGRWQLLVQSYESYLAPDDRQVLREAMNEVMAEKFTEAVMKELMGAEDDDPLGKSQKAHSGMLSGSATQGQFSGQSLYQQAQQAQLTQTKLALQAQLAQNQQAGLGALSNGTVTLSTAGRTVTTWANEDTKSGWQKFKEWIWS